MLKSRIKKIKKKQKIWKEKRSLIYEAIKNKCVEAWK